MAIRTTIGVIMIVLALGIAGNRLWYLYRLAMSGQKVSPDRTADRGAAVKSVLAEVFGQVRLLQFTVPGVAHFVTFWGFIFLLPTVLEGFGAIFDEDFHIPFIGKQAWLGFIEDVAVVGVLLGILTFAIIRFVKSPAKLGRQSRFFGSHLSTAWVVLVMITMVLLSLLLYRGTQINVEPPTFPFYESGGAFASEWVGSLLAPLGPETNELLEHIFVLFAVGVLLGFLVLVVYSKHLHIFTSEPNVFFKRQPIALGALEPIRVDGKDVDFENIDELDEDAPLGIGKIEDFTWKGMLDFMACTECGRCQSQCPAWNTEKPLSPKLLIMGLRDHAFAKGPYLIADSDEKREAVSDEVKAEVERPLIGANENGYAHAGDQGVGGVIDPDVLWSCTTCGACVQQCPVDIEHVDHILNMRRYQVLIESEFPSEAGVMLRNLEHAGDPWGGGGQARTTWMNDMDFDVRVFGAGGEDTVPADVEYLFWVGCAGAVDDKAKKTTKAVASLLHEAGVEFMVLGDGETCTGDPARRLGNEFLFQMLGQQNVEVLNEIGARKIVATCAHCFNTLANEYPQLGGNYEVVHHTQLLNQLVADGRLTPVTPLDTTITYHDPCYLGRHNQVFAPPREILEALPGSTFKEMPRNSEMSFCCGAGGARMWMEESIGSRVNENRSAEALDLKPDVVAAACPFCIVMLSDGTTAVQASRNGDGGKPVEVTDISELLLRSVRPATAPAAPPGG
ncbi:MAG: (Fe-S)-binding protein [Jiangellales bacterium]